MNLIYQTGYDNIAFVFRHYMTRIPTFEVTQRILFSLCIYMKYEQYGRIFVGDDVRIINNL